MTDPDLVLLVFSVVPLILGGLTSFLYRRHGRVKRRAGSLALLVAANLATLLFLASLVLPAGEIYYRFFHDATDGWDLGLVTERWYGRYYRTNNLGIRDNVDYRYPIEPGRRRLTVIGDSFANGHGLRDVEQRFTNRIRRAHPEWEVHLLAADGVDTGGHLERLRTLVARGYELDEVLYAYCLNDITDISEEWKAAAAKIGGYHPGFLARNSYFLNTWYYRFKIMLDPAASSFFDYVVHAHRDRTWGIHAERLDQLIQVVGNHGGRLRVVTFPFLETVSRPEFREIHSQLAALWDSRGVPHLDLTGLFEEFPIERLWVNRYDTHPNAFANGLAADAILDFWANRRRERPRARSSSPNEDPAGPVSPRSRRG